MDISTVITKENITEVREIMSKHSNTDVYAVRIGSYLNLDTDWNNGAIDSDFLFVLHSDSNLLNRSTLVSYEEFKQYLFNHLMES